MGLGEFFSLASAVTWAVAVILFQRSGESMRPFALNLFKNGLAMVVLLVTVVLFSGSAWPDFSASDIGLMLASGLLGVALGDTLYFKALNTIGAGRTGILASLYSPSVILLSYLLLGERLNGWQFVGFSLVLGGVLLVSYQRRVRAVSGQALGYGVLCAVAAVFLMALGVVMVKRLLESQPFLWIVSIRLVGGFFGMVVVMLLRRRTRQVWAEYRAPHRWWIIVVGSLLGAYVSMLLWLAGYKYTLASVASVLNETSSIFIVLLAWLILGERLSRRKLTGVGLTFSGVLLMVAV